MLSDPHPIPLSGGHLLCCSLPLVALAHNPYRHPYLTLTPAVALNAVTLTYPTLTLILNQSLDIVHDLNSYPHSNPLTLAPTLKLTLVLART